MNNDIKPLLTPKLRFQEFQNKAGFRVMKLSALLFEAKHRNRTLELGPADVLSVSGEHGCVNQIEFMGRSYAGVTVKDYHVVENGDIVYTKSPLKRSPYGIIKENKGRRGIVSTLYAVYRPFPGCSTTYLDHFFSVDYHLNAYLQPIVKKGAKNDMKVNNGDVLKGDIYVPELPEQQKIADCLNSVDELVAAQVRKLDALKAHKKGLMQQLFPRKGETQPRLRFPEFQDAQDWGIGPISQFAQINPRREVRPDDVEVSFVPMNAVSENGFLAIQQTRKYGSVKKGFTAFRDCDVILAKITPCFENGKAALVRGLKNEVGFGSTEFHVIRAQKLCLPEFIFAQLYSDQFRRLGKASMTGTGGHQRVPASFVENYVIRVPGLPEQQRIVNCLTSLDELIAAQSAKLEAVKIHKKGLMQQLFPSPKEVEG